MDQYPNRLADLNLHAELSAAELDVAQLLVCGLTTSAIAVHLFRSEHTVRSHIRRLLRKTGTTNRCHLVVWMYEAGHLLPAHPGVATRPRPPAIPPPSSSPASRGTTAQHLHRALTAARLDLDAALTHLDTLRNRPPLCPERREYRS